MTTEKQTIAAISTALSPGGISIIRVSGPEAFAVADRVFVSPGGKKKLSRQKSHTVHYGFVKDKDQLVDEVLATVFKAPKTYTAEDTVEFSCHGGILVTRQVLDLILRNGARLADPGEFTKRAFLNGRIDLSQAEAVMDVIDAKNRYALSASEVRLQGGLRDRVFKMRDVILNLTARIEAALDDPEHLSLDGISEELQSSLTPMIEQIRHMCDSFSDGQVLSEGIRTVILGKPNAGKSSLLNLFSGRERAIVTDVAGTTRDTLEEQITIGDISFLMVDTAGIRDTENVVERIGVEKAQKEAGQADLILYVVDSSRSLDEDDRRILPLLSGKRCIILVNKSDLAGAVDLTTLQKEYADLPVISISARTGEGLERFKEVVMGMFFSGMLSLNDEVILSNARQKEAMDAAGKSLSLVMSHLDDGTPEDLLTIDLMDAYASLGYVIGEEIGDDLADRIFSRFCMGK